MASGVVSNMEKNFPEITGRKIVALHFNFDEAKESELVVKVALSAVSTEGAIKNLHASFQKSFEELAGRPNGLEQ